MEIVSHGVSYFVMTFRSTSFCIREIADILTSSTTDVSTFTACLTYFLEFSTYCFRLQTFGRLLQTMFLTVTAVFDVFRKMSFRFEEMSFCEFESRESASTKISLEKYTVRFGSKFEVWAGSNESEFQGWYFRK